VGAAAAVTPRHTGRRLREWLTPDRHDPTQVVLRRIVANVLDAGIILVGE
jgi:hypothetical protein